MKKKPKQSETRFNQALDAVPQREQKGVTIEQVREIANNTFNARKKLN